MLCRFFVLLAHFTEVTAQAFNDDGGYATSCAICALSQRGDPLVT